MKIAIFTDTYHPATNGIVFVIDTLYDNLSKLGHQITIVAPRPGLRASRNPKVPGRHVIWLPAFEALFDENLVGLYSMTGVARRLSVLNFEAVIIFTPAQTGLLGAYLAKRNQLPLIEQYSTDLVEYVKHYPVVVPAIVLLAISAPFALKMNMKQIASVSRQLLTFRSNNLTWSQKTVRALLTGLHNSCDLVVCVSEKNVYQLKKQGVKTVINYIPTGVDKLPVSSNQIAFFRQKYNLQKNDFVLLYVGRLGAEKNLDLLIDAYSRVVAKYKNIRLMMVGDFDYRTHLEARVEAAHLTQSVIFTGRLAHHKLGNIYALADIFVFPSLTDTQGLVLNEAAHSGLPIIWCDKDVNGVAVNGQNAIFVKPRLNNLANAIVGLYKDEAKRLELASNSRVIAKQFSATKMTAKLANAIQALIEK